MSVPLKVPCPACGTRNQVPADRLGDGPVCGRCREPLFPGKPLELDAAGFDLHATRSGLPLLVDFWAPWCGPCKMVAPILEELSEEYGDKIQVVKLNTDENPAVTGRYGITGIPTMNVYVGGEVVKTLVGALPKQKLVRELEDFLG